jgi:hypothetical protein
MDKPIYLLVLATGMTEAWHQLSKAEQDALWGKVQAADEQAGATWLIACDPRWANEEFFRWAVAEYPSMDAYLAKVAALEQINWWRYFTGKTILGTRVEQ